MARRPEAGGEPKPMDDPMDPMGGDPKPMAGDSKAQGDGKGEPKPSAGQQGGDAKPMSGEMGGMPMGGSPSQLQAVSGGGMPSAGERPASRRPASSPKDHAQENVQQAVPPQTGAQEDIRRTKRDEASKKQDEAIKQLEKALKELEKRLKQLREKELAKLLANLEERVGRMLRMQIEVKAATEGIDNGRSRRTTARRPRADIQKARPRPTRKWRSSPRPRRRSS